MRLAYILILVFISINLSAQSDSLLIEGGNVITVDTENVIEVEGGAIATKEDFSYHSPGKAALFSLFPGGGQFYNKRYWKIPAIYAALFVTGSFIKQNHDNFKLYEAEAINRYNNGDTLNFPDMSNEEILFNMDQYEYQRNLTILILVGVYILNIVDASVDAYFFEFDISPDVSLRAEPYIRPPDFNTTTPINVGLTLRLKL